MFNLFRYFKDDGYELSNKTFVDRFFSIYGGELRNRGRFVSICKEVRRTDVFNQSYLNVFIEFGVPISMFTNSNPDNIIEVYCTLTPVSFDKFTHYLSNACFKEFSKKQIRKTIDKL